MAWEFSTNVEYQEKLDWANEFVRAEVMPLDLAFREEQFDRPTPALKALIDPLKQEVRDHGLWATHLDPALGGQGYGQVKLALLNEVLGISNWAPIIFGCQAPDTGNAEILARYGTPEQKQRFLQPLLNGEIFSSYSMTEPHGGADPKVFTTTAVRDGDEWVINGEKYFSSNARSAEFLIVMAWTNRDVHAHQGMSMFLVPTDTPGITIKRNVATMWEPIGDGMHAWIRYDDVRVPAENLLGEEGRGFAVAQSRLGGGRIHHAMRTVARCREAFDMMCERALSRTTQGSLLAEKQIVQEQIAECWVEITQFRLLVLYTAWLIDQGSTEGARKEIAACKFEAARVLPEVVYKAMHLHGAIGVSNDLPLADFWMYAPQMGVTDGPSEVHKITLARQLLKTHTAAPGLFPTRWLPPRIEEARARYADVLEKHVANL